MLACDIVVQARAARRLSAEQIARLEKMVFGAGSPTLEGLETILLIDRYVGAGDEGWLNLLARAAAAAHVLSPGSHHLENARAA